MRRTLAVAALAAALFTAAACGGDDDTGAQGGSTPPPTEAPADAAGLSTDEVCDNAKAAVMPFLTELDPLAEELSTAMLSGDPDAQEEAAAKVGELVAGVATQLRDAASSSDDAELAGVLEAFADELLKFGDSVQNLDINDPSSLEALLDLEGLDVAAEAIGPFCD